MDADGTGGVEAGAARLWAAARAVVPDVDVPEATFVAAIAARATAGADLAALHAADLYLALGCALQLPAALRRLEVEHVARIGAWLGASERDAAVIDEVRQRVRARVLVGAAGAPPRIAEYSGRGPLGAWLRVVALREHASLHRRGSADDRADELDAFTRTAELSPELVALKARYAPVVTEAFRAALAALEPRARTLLRLCYVDGVGTEAIGRMYGVNKSTVSRWLAAARADVLDGAIAYVRDEVGAGAATAESLLGLVQSQLELSLHGLLGA